MTAAAQKLYRERVASRRAGNTEDPLEQCLPPGTPRSLWSGEPVLITQSPAKVTLFHQYRHLIRHVFLDGPRTVAEPDPIWEGHSSGWWDGDTLRIQTLGFNGEQWLDAAGLPQSPDMKVDEALGAARCQHARRHGDGGGRSVLQGAVVDPSDIQAPSRRHLHAGGGVLGEAPRVSAETLGAERRKDRARIALNRSVPDTTPIETRLLELRQTCIGAGFVLVAARRARNAEGTHDLTTYDDLLAAGKVMRLSSPLTPGGMAPRVGGAAGVFGAGTDLPNSPELMRILITV